MTNEEIIKQLQDLKDHCEEMYDAEVKNGDSSNIIWGKDVEALTMAIKALEQTSEDCISRQAVIDAIAKIHPIDTEYDCTLYDKLDVMYVLKDLPSVMPQPKATGHWIDIMVGDMQAQACDQCKTFYPLAYTGGGHRFCPNCGAKMEEVEK